MCHQTLATYFPYKYPNFQHPKGQKIKPYWNSTKITSKLLNLEF